MWQLQHGQSLRHHLWGEECVIYNDLTGHTHLLDIVALDLLLALRAGPQDLASLCMALGGPEAAPADIAPAITALLEELYFNALVEPC